MGGTISDAAITLAAVDPCYCCTERLIVLDKHTDKDYEWLGPDKTVAGKDREG